MKPSQRHKARQLALQALYQWHLTQDNITDIEQQFITDNEAVKGADVAYFSALFSGTTKHIEDVEQTFSSFLSRALNQLDLMDRAILRLATYEMKHHQDVPYRVIINEAIELAKDFAANDSHKFINGVLDKVSKSLGKH